MAARIKGIRAFESTMGTVPDTFTTWNGQIGILVKVNLEMESVTYRFGSGDFTISYSDALYQN